MADKWIEKVRQFRNVSPEVYFLRNGQPDKDWLSHYDSKLMVVIKVKIKQWKYDICVCEFSDGREGKKRRGEHLRRKGYGVLRGLGTETQVHTYSESRVLDWVRSLQWRWITLLNNWSQGQGVVVWCNYLCLGYGMTLGSRFPEHRWEESFTWGWWISYFPWGRQAEINSWPPMS